MRIALITPYYYPSVRGNAVTVGRIAAGLRERGHQGEVLSLDACKNAREIPSAIRVFDPDLLHGFHAFMTGELVVNEAKADDVPPLVTITGTDVNIDLFHPEREESSLLHSTARPASDPVPRRSRRLRRSHRGGRGGKAAAQPPCGQPMDPLPRRGSPRRDLQHAPGRGRGGELLSLGRRDVQCPP